MRSRQPLLHRALLVALLPALGCSGDGPLEPVGPDPSQAMVGAFRVIAVDGKFVPWVTNSNEECQMLYAGGWLVVEPDSSCHLSIDRLEVLCGGQFLNSVERIEYGRVQVRGDTLDFRSPVELNVPFSAVYMPQAGGRDQLDLSIDYPTGRRDYFLTRMEFPRPLELSPAAVEARWRESLLGSIEANTTGPGIS